MSKIIVLMMKVHRKNLPQQKDDLKRKLCLNIVNKEQPYKDLLYKP